MDAKSLPQPATARSMGLRGMLWGILGLWLGMVSPASAHHERASDVAAGAIAIPSLSHSQMSVFADNLDAIRSLAERQYPTDPNLRKLQNFINLQSFMCLWGMVPGSLSNEDSPFNECAHAYLAAARALLLHIGTMPGPNHVAASALRSEIEVAMLDHKTSLVICRYSGEPFSTSDFITPHWRSIPLDPISILKFCALLIAAGATAFQAHAHRRASLDKLAGPASSGGRS